MLPGYRYIIFRTVGPPPTQARIHTGFQRFPEIGQKNNKKIIKMFLIIIKLSKLNQKPLKANFRESKSKQITGGGEGACLRALLEAFSLGPRLGNQSVFTLGFLICLSVYLHLNEAKLTCILLSYFLTDVASIFIYLYHLYFSRREGHLEVGEAIKGKIVSTDDLGYLELGKVSQEYITDPDLRDILAQTALEYNKVNSFEDSKLLLITSVVYSEKLEVHGCVEQEV